MDKEQQMEAVAVVIEEMIKRHNIPVRYEHNRTCYDCLERLREKYCTQLDKQTPVKIGTYYLTPNDYTR